MIRLYEKLRTAIPNLREHCRSHFSEIVPSGELMTHTLLFLLISLDFDAKLGLPLGSIFDYDRYRASIEENCQKPR